MRISIDATPLLLRSSGVKNYVYYWLRSLQQLAGPDAVSAFPFLHLPAELDHENSALGFLSTWMRLGLVIGSNYAPFSLLDLVLRGIDIFHMSNILVRNPPRRCRRTATLHDMTCWLMPELHTPANVKAAADFAARVLPLADGLIAVSESTRRDAARILHLPPERIAVIHPGVADAFFSVTADSAADIRSRYCLDRPYALYIGTIEPRKNLDVLLDAWQSLPASLHDQFELILAGPVGWGRTRVLERLTALTSARYLGYIPEADLPGITAGATAFAYPSLYEGFGFPVVQAMAAGVPVLTSLVSSLPEIVGDAALLADPHSPTEIAAGLRKLLTSASLCQRLAAAGRIQAERFRWQTCARRSLEYFQLLLGQ